MLLPHSTTPEVTTAASSASLRRAVPALSTTKAREPGVNTSHGGAPSWNCNISFTRPARGNIFAAGWNSCGETA